ncbi:MAG: PIN domain-containing protein [Anaerolineae bacterium]
MRLIMVDTSALCALVDRGELRHSIVTRFIQEHQADFTLLVTDYLLDETATWIKARFGPKRAIEFGRKLRSSDFCRYHVLTAEDEAATWAIFEKYDDKAWSYTDCSCLAVMQQLNITEILSLDSHFRQMGVQVWP